MIFGKTRSNLMYFLDSLFYLSGSQAPYIHKVCRLMHSLYGLKQAGQVWNRTFAHTIKRKLGFDTIHSDAGVYVPHHHNKRGDSNTNMILILHVDNLLLLGEDFSKIEDVKCQLSNLYQMKDLGPASSYLGI